MAIKTVDEAVEILKRVSVSDPIFAEAKKFVEENDQHNPILLDVRAKELQAEVDKLGGEKKDSKADAASAEPVVEDIEEEISSASDNADVFVRNERILTGLTQESSYEEFRNNEDIKSLIDHIEITETKTDKNGKQVKEKASPEKKEEYFKLKYQASELKSKLHFIGNETFAELSPEQQKRELEGLRNRLFFADTCSEAVGTKLAEKTPEFGTKEYEEVVKKQSEVALKTLNDVLSGRSSIAIDSDQILAGLADTAGQVDAYVNSLREKAKKLGDKAHIALNNISAKIKSDWSKIEKTANYVSENRYEIFKNLKKSAKNSFKDNKVQLISNFAWTGALGLTAVVAPEVFAGALVAYGCRMAAAAWVDPLIAETRKIKRERKEANLKPISFKNRWKMAKEKKFSETIIDPKTGKEIENKEHTRYVRRAAITTGVAFVSFGLLARHVSKLNTAGIIKDTLRDSGLIRMGAPIVAQANDTVFAEVRTSKAKKAQRAENNEATQKELEEAKAERRQARIGLIAGIALAGTIRAGSKAISDFVQNSGIATAMGNIFHNMNGGHSGAEDLSASIAKGSKGGNGLHNLFHGKKSAVQESLVAKDTTWTAVSDSARVEAGPKENSSAMDFLRSLAHGGKGSASQENLVAENAALAAAGEEAGVQVKTMGFGKISAKSGKSGGLFHNWFHGKGSAAQESLTEDNINLMSERDTTMTQVDTTGRATGDEIMGGGSIARTFEPFPKDWDPNMVESIEKPYWDLMMSRINNGMIKDIDPNGLDRAWANLDQVVAETGGNKAETFYNYAELMRNGRRHVDILFDEKKGYYFDTPTGSQTIEDEGIIAFAKSRMAANEIPQMARPHGREFLIQQLDKVNIEGMDTEKREAIIKIAMETYDKPQVAGAVEKIHEMFPDMTRAQLTRVRAIVDYNRAFNENGEVMEQLQRAINCGDMNGFDKDRVTLLLNQRAEILARSNGDAVAYSQEVGDCNGTMLHSRKIHTPAPKPEPAPAPEPEQVIEPAPKKAAAPMPKPDPVPVPEPEPQPEPTPEPDPEPVVEKKGREFIAENEQDDSNPARVEREVPNKVAQKNIRYLKGKSGSSRN